MTWQPPPGPGPHAGGPWPPGPWPPPRPAWPPSLRRPQTYGYPLVATVLGSIVVVVLLIGPLTATRDRGTGVAAIALCALWAAVGAAVLRWVDRWEPEPPHLLVAAFFWGVGVLPLTSVVAGFVDALSPRGTWQAYILAPALGQLFALCFLLLVLLASRSGRRELTSLADVVVYAGFVGLGHGFATAITEVASLHTWRSVLQEAFGTLVLGAYAPVVATVLAGVGLWMGIVSPPPRRFVAPLLGIAAAVCLAVWSEWASVATAVPVRLAALAAVGWLLARGLRGQDAVLARHLPHMVARGWLDPADAAWLATIEGRRARRRAARPLGRAELVRLDALRDNVSTLAFLRDRLDARHAAGRTPGLDLLAQHDELVGLLLAYRELRAAGG